MIERAKEHGIPGDIVLADSAYGTSHLFRQAILCAGVDHGVAIHSNSRYGNWTRRGAARATPYVPTR